MYDYNLTINIDRNILKENKVMYLRYKIILDE